MGRMSKDTVTIPVKVEKDGRISVLFSREAGLFSLDRTSRHSRVLSARAATTIVPAADPERITAVVGIESPLSGSNHMLVTGNAAAFGAPGDNQRWVSPGDMVFGPAPEGADPATLDKLYTGALPKEDVVAMMSAVHEVRRLRLGNPARDTTLAGLFILMADNPQQVAVYMDPRQDMKLPPLDLRQPPREDAPGSEAEAAPARGTGRSRRAFFQLGAQLVHAARIVQSPDLLTAAMKVLAHGSTPKPA